MTLLKNGMEKMHYIKILPHFVIQSNLSLRELRRIPFLPQKLVNQETSQSERDPSSRRRRLRRSSG